MTLVQMLLISLFAIVMTLGFLGLLRSVNAMSRVPAKVPIAVVTLVCLAAFGTQGVLSNLAAVQDAREKRVDDVVLSLAAKAALETGDGPCLDVSAAGNWDNPAFIGAIADGESVELSTVSGKPATLRLGAIKDTSYRAVLTYDGSPITVFEGAAAAAAAAENSKGFPQLLGPPQLPPL